MAPVQRVTDFLAEVATPPLGDDPRVNFLLDSDSPSGSNGRSTSWGTSGSSGSGSSKGGIPSSYRLGVRGEWCEVRVRR